MDEQVTPLASAEHATTVPAGSAATAQRPAATGSTDPAAEDSTAGDPGAEDPAAAGDPGEEDPAADDPGDEDHAEDRADGDPTDGDPDDDPVDDEDGRWHPLLRVLTVLGAVALVVGTLVVLGLRYDVAGRLLAPDRTATARVGDCLARLPDVAESGQRKAAAARIVGCSSPEAAYDVVGRLDGQTAERTRDSRQCEPFVTAGGAYYTYSSLPEDGTGYLLCLVPRA